MRFLLSLIFLFSGVSASASRGGVSGGGGNMISPRAPSKPVSLHTAERLVYHAREALLSYVNKKRIAFEKGQLGPEQALAFAPIFNAGQKIETVISEAQLHVAERHSCWDENHQPVDGSTITPVPDAICISAFNISRKADVSDIPPQSAALMLHEYSELIGLDEEQAVQAQTKALEELRGF
jgi:hypothetical protein